jgi:hypothetical protein
MVDHSELQDIVKFHPDYFEEELNDDGDFNKLTLFVMYEKLKGKKSFWAPMFELTE